MSCDFRFVSTWFILFITSFQTMHPVFEVFEQYQMPDGKIISLLGDDHVSERDNINIQHQYDYIEKILSKNADIEILAEVELQQEDEDGYVFFTSPVESLINNKKLSVKNIENRFFSVGCNYILRNYGWILDDLKLSSSKKSLKLSDISFEDAFKEYDFLLNDVKNKFPYEDNLKREIVDYYLKDADSFINESKNIVAKVQEKCGDKKTVIQQYPDFSENEIKKLDHLILSAFATLFDMNLLFNILNLKKQKTLIFAGSAHIIKLQNCLFHLGAKRLYYTKDFCLFNNSNFPIQQEILNKIMVK